MALSPPSPRSCGPELPAKVLFTIPNFITAGSGLALLQVARGLDRDQFQPMICVLKRGGGALEATIEELGIPLHELPFTVAARPLHRLAESLWRAASRFKPLQAPLWHSFHYLDDYTEPLIARLSGARRWIYTKKNMSWGSRAWWLRSRLAARIAIQNPEMIEECFSAGSLRRRARLIPTGVDTERFRPGQAKRLALRDRFGLGPTDFLIGTVAQLIPRKDIPTLMGAVASMADVHVVVAGTAVDQTYVDRLYAIRAELGLAHRVHFIGSSSDIPALHAELDVFVLPSLSEGCAVALLEAMACGVASIATDIPGSRQVIEHGRSGLLVPVSDAPALAMAIRSLLNSPERKRELAASGRRRIEAEYTAEVEVRRYQDLYRELLASSNALSPRGHS